jgi:hypothetical protein
MVVNQNVAANKVDYYLKRTIQYSVNLDPGARTTAVTGRVEVTLENDARSTGLPADVIGPYTNQFVAGENRSYISVYAPFVTSTASVDGSKVTLQSQQDLGRRVASTVVSVPALTARTLTIPIHGQVVLNDGWYRLDLPHQTTLAPDHVQVSISLAPGWKVAQVRGATPVGGNEVRADFQQTTDDTIWVQVERTGLAKVWDRLRGRP